MVLENRVSESGQTPYNELVPSSKHLYCTIMIKNSNENMFENNDQIIDLGKLVKNSKE